MVRSRSWRWLLVTFVVGAVVGAVAFGLALHEAAEQLGVAGSLGGLDSGDTSVAWAPDGKHIVVGRGQEGHEWLYRLDADGGNPRRLITSMDLFDPALSPDGSRLAFAGYAGDELTVDLFSASADGADVTQLTRTGELEGDPDWSPDGSEIAFVRGADLDFDSDLFVMRADGTDVRHLTHGVDAEEAPDWSPDGTAIAYLAYPRVYVISPRGNGARRPLTTGLRAPAWSPDGRRLAVIEDTTTVKVVTLRTGGIRRLELRNPVGADEVRMAPDDLAWSPDGTRLAYTAGGSLYTIEVATGTTRRLTHCVQDGDASCAG